MIRLPPEVHSSASQPTDFGRRFQTCATCRLSLPFCRTISSGVSIVSLLTGAVAELRSILFPVKAEGQRVIERKAWRVERIRERENSSYYIQLLARLSSWGAIRIEC